MSRSVALKDEPGLLPVPVDERVAMDPVVHASGVAPHHPSVVIAVHLQQELPLAGALCQSGEHLTARTFRRASLPNLIRARRA